MNVTVLCLSLLCSPPAVRSLAHSYRDGDIQVDARAESGYSVTSLRIINRRDEDIVVDVNGSYLRPQVHGIQRIGIGIVRRGNGDTTVRLAAGETVDLEVLTVCMDASLSAPSDGQSLILAERLAPKAIRGVLREWKRNPRARPSLVQQVVWRTSRAARRRIRPTRRIELLDVAEQVAVTAGRFFVLEDDGRLFSDKNLALLEPVGSRFRGLWAGDATFALREVDAVAGDGPRSTSLVRFDADSGQWSGGDISVPAASARDVLWVSRSGREVLIHRESGDVVRLDGERELVVARGASEVVVSGGGGLVYWTPDGEPQALYAVDRDGRRVRTFRVAAGIAELATTGSEVYVLDREGLLRCIRDGAFEEVCGDVEFIATSGAAVIVAHEATSDGGARTSSLRIIQSGKPSFVIGRPATKSRRFLFDPTTDDLHCWAADGSLLWYNPRSEAWHRMRVSAAE